MKKYRVVAWLLMFSMISCICCGCKNTVATESTANNHMAVTSMEDTAVVNYTLPQVKPNILVNQRGYQSTSAKEVTVKGKMLPEEFRLVSSETGEVVYSGFIEEVNYNEEAKLYTGVAVFSDYTVEGTFFLECDVVGRSLDFPVQGDTYEQLFLETYNEMIVSCREQKATVPDITALLTAYEWYPTIFPDSDWDEIPDVLEEIAAWIEQCEKNEDHTEEGTLYVAALAKFSYLYQKYDIRYATECLQHASAVFEQLQKPIGKDADNFYALTELYRATGLTAYNNQIKDYATFFKDNTSYLEEQSYLYGAMTYIATRQSVDVAMCDIFMDSVMSKGEEISKLYEEMIHPVTAKNNGADDLLKRVRELSCCNYILNNYQYTSIMEEFLHYLLGKNVESVCFYPDMGEKSGYLFLLAQLTATAK